MKFLENVAIEDCIDIKNKHSGMKFLFKSLVTNNKTLKYLNIRGNDWNNDKECI